MTQQQNTFVYCTNPLTVLQCPKPCIILRFPNSTATDILVNGIPEQPLIDWCKQFCNSQKTFIDIGAHAGTYSLSLSPYCKTVHAFECQKETYYQLCGGIALNAYWNVTPHHIALGHLNTPTAQLNIVSLDGGGTTLLEHHSDKKIETDSVEMKTLDSYQLDNIGFLKIDVEGFEENVLRGAVETLKRSNFPSFIFESWTDVSFSDQKQSLYKFITETLGYRIIPITGYSHMMFAEHTLSASSV